MRSREYEDLTPGAQADRDEFEAAFGRGGNCSCHLSPPCNSCLHPGNPLNQAEDDTAWRAAESAGEVLYRYKNRGDVVLLEKYHVTKRTPRGAWINVYGKPKFVLTGTFKKFAAPTEEEAKASFFARKARQLRILKSQIEGVEGAVEALKEGRLADYRGSIFDFDY